MTNHAPNTAQEIFDKAVSGVIRQGMLARNPQLGYPNLCQYRTPEGLACAVGQLIDDETAKKWDLMEDTSVDLVWPDAPHLELLKDLQDAHDHADSVADFRERAADVARVHNLSMENIPQ